MPGVYFVCMASITSAFNLLFSLCAFSLAGILIMATCSIMALMMFVFSRSKVNIIWGIFCVTVFIWGLGAYKIGLASDPHSALNWWRLAYVGVIWIPALFIHFVYIFLQLKPRIPAALFYAVSFFYLVLNAFPGWFVHSVHLMFGDLYYLSPTPVYTSFVVFFAGTVIYAHILLYKAYRRAQGDRKKHIFYFSIGSLVGYIGGGFAFLPVYGISIYPY